MGLLYFAGTQKLAGVAELVDAPDSKSGNGNIVRVRVSPPAPSKLSFHFFG